MAGYIEDEILFEATVATLVILHEEEREKKKEKKMWVREWVARRSRFGAYSCLLKEISSEDSRECRRFLRMSSATFYDLLHLIEPAIRRQDTVMRQCIQAEERLAVTLRYLGSGNSFADLAFLFRIPGNTIHKIVMDTCAALYRILRVDFLKVPSTEAEWQQISLEFAQRWNLPNCIGAIDGKHVAIRSPGGSTHYNYLKFHSIILLAVVDAKYRFLYFNVGANGRAGDAGVFRDSTLAAALENNTLNIPTPVPLPGRVTPVHILLEDTESHRLIEGDWRQNPHQLQPLNNAAVNRSSTDARLVREEVKNYVNEEGTVPWQSHIVFG
ncbi:putative nuclease HARBI1 [Pomacea canaliculata]|uniref:putative nuclease HARBI1 n=1 Tax=Pomacea canaliculata TaxID=400727 RepID=UPI000D725615|nr:putative nuclease HARBI1 [Pomacea canaliculata]